MMYDPLPPLDSVSCYPPPSSHPIDDENPVVLFLRSFFPSFSQVRFKDGVAVQVRIFFASFSLGFRGNYWCGFSLDLLV